MQRRDFLRRHLLAALGGVSLYSQLGNLQLVRAAALDGLQGAKGAPGYKALVCVFLDGGNDNVNTLIPRSATHHALYAAARPNLALPLGDLTAATHLAPATAQPDGRLYALHPNMVELRNLFQAGRCAIVANVGPLIEPVTRSDYQTGAVEVPPQLFSHSDQQVFWQTSRPDSTQKIGWGGRLADLLQSQNVNQQLPMSLSLSGQNVFQTGASVQPYSVGNNGPVERSGYNGDFHAGRRTAIDALLAGPQSHILERAVADVHRRSIDLYDLVSASLSGGPTIGTAAPTLPEANAGAQGNYDRLIAQLRMAARLISVRGALGQQRQVFFVTMGGFDFHDRLLVDHGNNMRALSLALNWFQSVMDELGVAESVTTFTASDFGRTMTANGDGSDHGWGGEHFVLGGAVNGGDIYGELSGLVPAGPDDAGWGQIIPKLAVDQYAATLARWFGVSEANLDLIFPGIAAANPRFGPATGGFIGTYRDLGFMQPG